MSLLSVTVKKARYVGIQATQFNTYVTLKLQNVKSTTVTVKGPTPCWEQDFLFETNDINQGLLVEVWNKGVIWDRALGYHYLPLTSVAYNEECGGRWVELEAQLMMRGGAVVGTTGPTGHALLLDCRFEPPFDAEGTGGADLQRKLDLLNGALDAERAEQARRQMQYIAHSGYSEDSDYTSDLNYPVGQHANCSASQFRTAAHQMHTPQRSLEVSRENSSERDEYHMHGDTDPLYYNSQPRTNRLDTWSQLQAQASVESAISWRTAADWQSAEDQRRPSLERQNTLYDESMGYGYDPYSNSTHIRDHSHLSQQHSYEEYYDSSSYPYQMSYVADDSRQWDSGGRYYFDECYGLTSTEYENIVNKRRSSVVQLPQVPQKQLPASSRYSDFNGMAPYRPRQRRTAASLPATPSSTPKRGRALPVPPGSESGSVRSRGGRRLPRPPAPVAQHVPYLPETDKTIPDVSYGYDSYGYQPEYQDAVTEQYQDHNYNTNYDEDGMQPFFDETPHATPPAAAQKTPWSETETTTQFTYPVTSEEESLVPLSVPSTISAYLPQPPVTRKHDVYQDQSYQQYDLQYDTQPQYQTYDQQHQYQDTQYIDQTQDYQYQQQYEQEQYQDSHKQQQHLEQEQQYQEQFALQQQKQQQEQQLRMQQQQQQHRQQQQAQQAQQKQPTQQLQASVLTGAATLGNFMAGGAKKLGSLFGSAAAAMTTPAVSQPSASVPATTTHYIQSAVVAPVTPFTSTTTVPPSVPDVSPPVPTATTSASTTLHRTSSLRRQESIQRPSVQRTRTLPEAPEELPPSSYDESAYEDEYHKTEFEQSIDRDRTSLDRYNDDEYIHETIPEDILEESQLTEETALQSPSIQKTASPTRSGSVIRKPSLDSYHSQTPSIVDRRTSQSSFHLEEKLTVPTTKEETNADKAKVKFQEERTTFHEVPEEPEQFERRESFVREEEDRESFHDQDEPFSEDQEKFDDQEQFNEADEHYAEDEVFQDGQDRNEEEQLNFQPEQPKLTPRQRWHRAYNKIVMQLNILKMPVTRSQSTIQEAEKRILTLTNELQQAQQLNINLLKEQEECAADYADLIRQIASLKASLAEQDSCLNDVTAERDIFKEALEKNTIDIGVHEEALGIICVQEKNAALFEELQSKSKLENDKRFNELNKELEELKTEITKLQNENIKLRTQLKKDKTKEAFGQRRTTPKLTRTKSLTQKANRLQNTERLQISKYLNVHKNEEKSEAQRKLGLKRQSKTKSEVKEIKINKECELSIAPIPIEDIQSDPKNVALETLQSYENPLSNQNDSQEVINKNEHNDLNKTQPLGAVETTKRQTLILTDNYGKGLALLMNRRVSGTVTSICKPGAPLRELTRSIPELTKTISVGGDVVIIAMNTYGPKELVHLENAIYHCNKQGLRLQITTQPYLYDEGRDNCQTYITNKLLYKIVNKSMGTSIIEVNNFGGYIRVQRGRLNKKFLSFLCTRINEYEQNKSYINTNLTYLTNATYSSDNSKESNTRQTNEEHAFLEERRLTQTET